MDLTKQIEMSIYYFELGEFASAHTFNYRDIEHAQKSTVEFIAKCENLEENEQVVVRLFETKDQEFLILVKEYFMWNNMLEIPTGEIDEIDRLDKLAKEEWEKEEKDFLATKGKTNFIFFNDPPAYMDLPMWDEQTQSWHDAEY